MKLGLGEILSALRRETGRSQRQAASELGVSQALLSHYENGAREPKLEFITKACDYYGVSADYLLGRSGTRGDSPAGHGEGTARLARIAAEILAALEKTGDPELAASAVSYLAIPADNVTDLLRDPTSPYDPMRDAAFKLAEAEFISRLQRLINNDSKGTE